MLESFNTDKFEYKRLSPEEQVKRGILGRLVGIIADTKNATRNGRKYSLDLWKKVFENPIMKEKITNRCVFSELGHPADREEIDMEKVCACLAEQPKLGKDGKLYGTFDILDTPNGRLLKTLCDYGTTVGISSRGSGDLYTDEDGNEAVDPDTYNCETFDIVVVPAVEEARLQYVTESLDKKKYNKTLRQKLSEQISKASDEDKKIMKESLNTFGVDLSEVELHPNTFGGKLNEEEQHTEMKRGYDVEKYDPEDECWVSLNPWVDFEEDGRVFRDQMMFDDEAEACAFAEMTPEAERVVNVAYETINGHTNTIWSDENDESVVWARRKDVDEALPVDKDGNPIKGIDPVIFDDEYPEEKNEELDDLNRKNPEDYMYFRDQISKTLDNLLTLAMEADNFGLKDLSRAIQDAMNRFEDNKLNEEKYDLVGIDGNAFSVMGYVANALRREGLKDLVDEYREKAMSGDYDNLLAVSVEYIDKANEAAGENGNYDLEEAKKAQSGWIDIYSQFEDAIKPYIPGNPEKADEVVAKLYEPHKGEADWDKAYERWTEYDEEDLDEALVGVSSLYTKVIEAIGDLVVEVDSARDDDLYNKEDIKESIKYYMSSIIDYCKENAADYGIYDFNDTVDEGCSDITEDLDNDGAGTTGAEFINELQEALLKGKDLEKDNLVLQEKLSVCTAKESKLKEELNKYKNSTISLSDTVKELNESKDKVNSLTESLEKKENIIKSNQKRIVDLVEEKNESASKLTEATDTIDKLNSEVKSLTEKLGKVSTVLNKYKKALTESKKYYVQAKADAYGLNVNDITHNLNESYSYKDVDQLVEELSERKRNMSKLPFTINENTRITVKGKKESISKLENDDDDISGLLQYLK